MPTMEPHQPLARRMPFPRRYCSSPLRTFLPSISCPIEVGAPRKGPSLPLHSPRDSPRKSD